MFTFVFLKAYQQKNVNGNHYKAVLPVSWLMAATEFYVISVIVRVGYDPALVFVAGTGAGLGAMAAMYVHTRIYRDKT